MSNILDYILWRGDLPLQRDPINEVDGLILSQLAMVRWEQWLAPGEEAALSSLADRDESTPVSAGFTAEDDQKLMAGVTRCARFRDVRVFDYVHEYDEGAGMQFSAVSLLLPDGALFVAYRGTDSTLVGWKEDCNMAYSRPVPAQQAALDYLLRAASKREGPVYVGGHSKGGNLAMYAAALAGASVRYRIAAVYNNDGPGLSDLIDAQSLYARLSGKLFSFVPQSSIVGMLLAHPDAYEVVRSNSISILQHNPYSWQVEGPRFMRAPGLSKDSVYLESVFRKWLKGLDEKRRGAVVDTLFSILGATEVRSFGREFRTGLLRNPGALIGAMQRVDPESRREVSGAIGELIEAMMHPDADRLE